MAPADDGFCGLTAVVTEPLERHPIRARGEEFTRAAWRLRLQSDQGQGAIVLAEVGGGEAYYRGEGLFLGWPQEQLRSVYEAALKRSDGGDVLEIPQLG
jgi:hypothetical protein